MLIEKLLKAVHPRPLDDFVGGRITIGNHAIAPLESQDGAGIVGEILGGVGARGSWRRRRTWAPAQLIELGHCARANIRELLEAEAVLSFESLHRHSGCGAILAIHSIRAKVRAVSQQSILHQGYSRARVAWGKPIGIVKTSFELFVARIVRAIESLLADVVEVYSLDRADILRGG
jgi:hypothetical protein